MITESCSQLIFSTRYFPFFFIFFQWTQMWSCPFLSFDISSWSLFRCLIFWNFHLSIQSLFSLSPAQLFSILFVTRYYSTRSFWKGFRYNLSRSLASQFFTFSHRYYFWLICPTICLFISALYFFLSAFYLSPYYLYSLHSVFAVLFFPRDSHLFRYFTKSFSCRYRFHFLDAKVYLSLNVFALSPPWSTFLQNLISVIIPGLLQSDFHFPLIRSHLKISFDPRIRSLLFLIPLCFDTPQRYTIPQSVTSLSL